MTQDPNPGDELERAIADWQARLNIPRERNPIPDHVDAPWWFRWWPRWLRCRVYHALRIYSPSVAAVYGRLSCPLCGKLYK